MIFTLNHNNNRYECNTDDAHNIAITVKFDDQQPNHFGAAIATKEPLIAGGFIGDTKRGGSCNVNSITMVPHCNGTHTETVSHIVHQKYSVGENTTHNLSTCQLITIEPVEAKNTSDGYLPEMADDDKVIDLACLKKHISQQQLQTLEALVIRTTPNGPNKLNYIYDDQHQSPFFTHQAISWLAASNINHLLVDMPSIDKMYDDGLLSNHHIFWRVEPGSRLINDDTFIHRTITEMIYVDDKITDGLYCLNLQVPAFDIDAAPSRPLLYPLKPLKNP